MGLFGNSANPLEADIEKATSEKNVSEKWGMIMDICDRIGTSSMGAKESLKIIIKRLNHPDPHVVVQAITLLDACVNNCGKNYHLEIASREFENEFKRLIQKSQPPIANKLKVCLKKWAEGDFKKDPQLSLIPSLYNRLRQEGIDFTDTESTPKREVVLSKDPNVVSSQQEEDDIAKAIELSLKEKTASPKAQSSSLYPSVNFSNAASAAAPVSTNSAPAPEPRKVRALYDFEAAEDNELTFKAGEIIMVTEESDPNWWRGTNHRGEGFFPANFVTADLSVEPEDLSLKEASKSSKKSVVEQQPQSSLPVEVNEETIDRLLFLLHEADPSDPSQDSDEMLRLENVVNQMGPLTDSELERVDRKHAQLTQLSSDLIDTINLYHSLMRETERSVPGMFQDGYQMYPGAPGMGYPPNANNNMYRMPPSNMIPPPGMMPGSMMPGQNMAFPPTSSANFPMPPQSSGPGSFPPQNHMMQQQQVPVTQQQMMPGMNPHHQPMTNGFPQNPQQMMPQQGGPPQMMPSQQGQGPPQVQQQVPQQIPAQGQSYQQPQPHHQQTQPQPPPQQLPQNGIHQPNYQMTSNMQPQLSQMMGNMSLQSPTPTSMPHNMLPMGQHQPMQLQQQPQGPGMQITQPMTYNLQADNNQNIPVYQQQR